VQAEETEEGEEIGAPISDVFESRKVELGAKEAQVIECEGSSRLGDIELTIVVVESGSDTAEECVPRQGTEAV